ncbi:MAG TPA: DUF2207 domain-containing protein [Anaerovoracaceae bacterium]|nr:DUF2207 domain-containing protein [Anaerovoracaceae bacterium]
MKRGKLLAVIFCVTVLFCLNITFASAAESYVTRDYDVQMDVYKDNSFVVTEDIKVEFTEPRHGLFRNIPYKGTTVRQIEGKTVLQKYKIKITDVYVEDQDFETYKEKGNLVIRIGSPDYYVNGPQEYRIRYRCILYDDENETFDSLYWNILPNEWPTPIEASSMTVRMPKPFDPDMAEFIAGDYGRADMEAVDWSTDGTVMSADTTRILDAGEGVTVNVILPEGYFVGERTDAWMWMLMMLIIIAAPLLSILLWFRFGRDPQVVRTVEFYPPEGVNSAELGYIIDGATDSRDMVSLIIYWANEGYLTIREDEENKFTLIKKKDLPESAKTYEHTMFQGLFDSRDQVTLEDLKENFYGTLQAAKLQLQAHFRLNKENRIFTQSSIGARGLSVLLMLAPVAALAVFGAILNKSYDLLVLLTIPMIVFALIGFCVFIAVYDKKESLSKGKNAGLNILGFLSVVIFSLGTLIFSSLALENVLPGIAVTLASVITLIFTMRMKQRTKKSSQLLGKILGFKEFIRTAELERIKRLVEETPNYFYNVLPYAYVFGLTDKWAKKFEDIAVAPPAWYDAGYGGRGMFNTWIFMSSFNHYTNAMQHNITIPPAPSGGGVSGGGFSAGGGFSGGGMGGGGGGSW